MKSHLITALIAVVFGFVGGLGSKTFQSSPVMIEGPIPETQDKVSSHQQTDFAAADVALEITRMREDIYSLGVQLNEVVQSRGTNLEYPIDTNQTPTGAPEPRASGVSDIDNLAAAGVDPAVARDTLRRISQQQFRRMELTNLIRSTRSPERQIYAAELRELSQNNMSLRTELGDDVYDQYLFESGESNRVSVDSVMAGSPAETHGMQPGDVIQYYNDIKIIEVSDLQKAALTGDAGSYSNIEILRDGNLMNLMLPQGTIGVQLQPTRIDPAE
ncbi:MAG: PDZ domain-containing protein [Halioglobus sp.]